MFEEQTNTIEEILSFLPADIVTALIVLAVFLIALALWRIVS